jgi:holo-[acyl-carrier protein] synthase
LGMVTAGVDKEHNGQQRIPALRINQGRDLASDIRVGIDVADVSAVAASLDRFGDRYVRKVFTGREMADSVGHGLVAARGLAARFAAKEAVLKALRVTTDVPPWTDIEIVRSPGGWPELELHGVAARLAAEQGLATWALSLTHETDVAAAVVVASGPGITSETPHPA